MILSFPSIGINPFSYGCGPVIWKGCLSVLIVLSFSDVLTLLCTLSWFCLFFWLLDMDFFPFLHCSKCFSMFSDPISILSIMEMLEILEKPSIPSSSLLFLDNLVESHGIDCHQLRWFSILFCQAMSFLGSWFIKPAVCWTFSTEWAIKCIN